MVKVTRRNIVIPAIALTLALVWAVTYFGTTPARETRFARVIALATKSDGSASYIDGEGYVTDVNLTFSPNDPRVWDLIHRQFADHREEWGLMESVHDPRSRIRCIWVDARRGEGQAGWTPVSPGQSLSSV